LFFISGNHALAYLLATGALDVFLIYVFLYYSHLQFYLLNIDCVDVFGIDCEIEFAAYSLLALHAAPALKLFSD
jgi:hypothetical protein